MSETKVKNDFGWADPHSDDYRPEIIQLIENVAVSKASWAKNVIGTEVEVEDLQSELYAHLFAYPQLLNEDKFPSKILHNQASKYCFKIRTDKGAALLGTDTLNDILKNWNSIPQYILDFMYGPSFSKAGKPAGSYLEALEQAYKYGNQIQQRNLLSRAVARLAEVISGVMVGTPDSFTRIQQSSGIPTTKDNYTAEDYEDPDPTFKPYSANYVCDKGHLYLVNFPKKPKGQRIGTKTEYGYRYCKCGELLELAH